MLIKYAFVARPKMYKGVQRWSLSFDCAFDLGKSIILSHDFTTTGRASRRLILPDKKFELYEIRTHNLCVIYAL